jgi:hypothetical protein
MANAWLYEVTAEFGDQATGRAWADWIMAEHIADVIAAGALSGRLLRCGDVPNTYIAQYEFASEAAMREYLKVQSPILRAKAAERFDPAAIKYTRRTGEIIA